MNGEFEVYSGSLTIKPGKWAASSTSHAFRRMNGYYNDDINDGNDTAKCTYTGALVTVLDGAHLYVKGTSSQQIMFSGDMSPSKNDRHNSDTALIRLGLENFAPGTCSFAYTIFMDAVDNTGTGKNGHDTNTGMASSGIAVDGPGGSSADLTFTNCQFLNLGKRASTTTGFVSAGSAIHIDNGCRLRNIKIDKCKFTNCVAELGGAFRIANDEKTYSSAKNNKLTISDCTFSKCTGAYGGAMTFEGTVKEQVVVDGCNFTDCKATSGGAMYFGGMYQSDLEKSIKITGGTVINNCDTDKRYDSKNTDIVNKTRKNIGGAIASDDEGTGIAQLICDSVTIKNCNAYDGLNGGAIHWGFSNSKSSVTLNSGCKIQSNTSLGSGGSIYLRKNTLNIKGATISSNTSTNAGGAIRARSGSKVNMSSGTISSNKTNSTLGGGIYLDEKTTFNLSGGTIKSNKTVAASKDGGGVYTCGTMNMTGGTITSNTATQDGGGIFTTGTLTVSGGSITSNKSRNGGGIRGSGNSSSISIKYVETTAGQGDSKILDISTVPTISSNTSTNAGGAIYTNNYLFVNGGVFKSNTAKNYGGAIYVVVNASGNRNALNMNGATSGMTANSKKKTGSDYTILINGNSSMRGGGIAVRGVDGTNVQTHISEAEISNNKATNDDGNVANIVNPDNGLHSGGGGGGIWLAHAKKYGSDANLILTSLKIHDNMSTKGLGGGIFAINSEDIKMQSVDIYSNKSGVQGATSVDTGRRRGGGIAIRSTKIELYSGKIYGNIASGEGGGVYVAVGATFNTTSDSAVIGLSGSPNKGVQGGGIFCRGGTINMNHGKVQYNETTSGTGGGIYFYGDEDLDTAEFTYANISYNKAYSNGGGIMVFAGYVKINKGTVISYNEALNNNGGGIYIRKESPEILSRLKIDGTMDEMTKIHHNTARQDGGGLYVTNYNDTQQVEVCITEVEFYNNEALTKGGGGMYLRDPIPIPIDKYSDTDKTTRFNDARVIRLANVYAYNNKAKTYGGGILAIGGNYNLGGNKIYDNSANIGGGVGVFKNDESSNSTYLALSTYNADYPTSVYNNTATTKGGGVYVGCDLTDQTTAGKAVLYVDGASIKNNKAQDGGGIAVQTVKVYDGTVTKGHIIGQAYLYRNPTTNVISAIENNTAENGGGGGIFVTDGSDVYDFGVYIRYNKATGTNDATIPWNQRTTAGIGGGVYVGSGLENSSNNTNFLYQKYSSTYTEGVKADSDGKYEFGLYRNEASFAADDLYSTGIKTNINAPNSNQLKLLNYNGDTDGWFEDFANGDVSYGLTDGKTTVNDTVVTTNGIKYNSKASRYNDSIHTPVSDFDKSKSFIEIIDTAEENVITAGKYNTYVAMTYGIKSAGFLTINKDVVDSNGNDLNDVDNTEYIFQIMKVPYNTTTEIALSEDEISNVTVDITDTDGTTVDGQKLASDGTFKLTGGGSAYVVGLPYGEFNLIVKELVEGQDYNYKVKETKNKTYLYGNETNPANNDGATTGLLEVVNGANTIVDFTNTMSEIEIKIKFYNRDYVKIVNGEPTRANGTPADIADEATVYTKSFLSNYSFEQMIILSAITANNKAGLVNNILDEYYCYTTQAEAVSATNYETHSNKYGKNGEGAVYSDNSGTEKWVTYIDVNDKEITNYASVDDIHKQKVKSITVWLENEPKKYTYDIYQVDNFSQLNEIDDGKFIANKENSKKLNTVNTNNSENVAYYNQRFYHETYYDSEGQADEATNYLNGYELKPWLDVAPETAEEIVGDDGTTYYFSYWASDPYGEIVASTEIDYRYRITNNLTLYPVYDTTPNKKVGLSVSQNAIDVYGEGDVQKTVLNTMMNPYNCSISDKNILDVGIIYVIDSKGNVTEGALNLNAPYVDPDYVPERTLYFVPDSNWNTDGARFAAYLTKVVEEKIEDAEGNITISTNIEESKWIDLTYDAEYGIFECVIEDDKWTNVEFCQMSGTENIDTNVVKRTGSLDLGDANCYTIGSPIGDWSASTTLTLVPGPWTYDGVRYAARFAKEVETTTTEENEEGETVEVTVTEVQYEWVNMTASDSGYTCAIPTGYTDVSFCQMSGSENSDANIVSKTDDLTLEDGNYCFTIDQIGAWSSYSKTKTFYFTPDADWIVDGASFKALFTIEKGTRNAVTPQSEDDTTDGVIEKFEAVLTDENGDGIYECTVPNSGWTNVTFCQVIDGTVNSQSDSIVINSTDNNFTLNSYSGEWSSTPITSYSLVPSTIWTGNNFAARFSYVAEEEQVEDGETIVVEKHFYSDWLAMSDSNGDGKFDVNIPAVSEGNPAWSHITFYQMNGSVYSEDNITSQTDDLALGLGECYTITVIETETDTETGESTESVTNAKGEWSSEEITSLKVVPGAAWNSGNIYAQFTIVTETQGAQQFEEDGTTPVLDEDGNPVYEIIETITYTDFIPVTDADGDGVLDVQIPDNANIKSVTFYQKDDNGNIVKNSEEFTLGSDDIITITNRAGEWSTFVITEEVYTNLDMIRDVIQAKLSKNFSGGVNGNKTFVLDLSAELQSLGIARGNCRVYYAAGGNILTNRNRVQFSEKFTTDSLKNRRIYAFAAMYYAGDVNEWIVSDNCIDYRFNENGAEYMPDDTAEPDTEDDQTSADTDETTV